MRKVCPQCKKEKKFDKFTKGDKRCRKCLAKKALKYRKSKAGVLSIIYAAQKQSSKKRNHPMPNYTKEELGVWLHKQELFNLLFRVWELKNYDKYFKPSCDRVDSLKSYTLDNLELTTWGDNERLYKLEDNKRGLQSDIYRPVNQYTMNMVFVATYTSINEAMRITGATNIGRAIKDEYKHAGGFKWRYADENK